MLSDSVREERGLICYKIYLNAEKQDSLFFLKTNLIIGSTNKVLLCNENTNKHNYQSISFLSLDLTVNLLHLYIWQTMSLILSEKID